MKSKIAVLCLVFFVTTNLLYGRSITKTPNKNKPINITSEKVNIIRNKNEIIFIEKVKAVQDRFTLYSDKMIVKYRETEDKKMEILNIKTEKNVKFISEDVIATGSEGFYDLGKNIITLKNNVTATENDITVFADQFEYNIVTGKTNIIGNKQNKERVTVILDGVGNIKN